MSAAQVFDLPDLGEGLTEAELVRWLVAVGEVVGIDQPVAEVETAKAMVEVPSPFAGTVLTLHGAEGATLPVGAPLLTVGEPGAEPAGETYREEDRAGSGNVLIGYGTAGTGGSRRRRRRGASGAVPGSVADAEPVTSPATGPVPGERVPAQSPVVRRLARDHGIDLAEVIGSGPGGMVLRRDVARAAVRADDPATGSAEPATGAGGTTHAVEPSPAGAGAASRGAGSPAAVPGSDQRTGLAIRETVPIRGVRRAVTEKLTRSRQEIPEATTWVDVDATDLLALRPQLAGADGRPVGLIAIVARFVVAGLARFPELNARVDTGAGEIVHLDGVNLGIAAQTDRGLVVPSVAGAHRLGMRGLDTEIRRLVTAARDGSVPAAELTRGSFTLNNYGVLGVDGSAAIINHPEVAMLGIGRVLPRPWVVGGEVVPRSIAQLSLVFDHRVCDGGTAGGFLRFVADAVESPLSALADL
ncbi:dihydrolipoamide acetyltransferase family protein [Pseudonocardia parietis]|uniref:Dihydrolipoamide acetyltransferase component of pyruvate dehydrogenase complex n=1 Tax=Pseudonocardia parietis TaxID=570936 RepID=A0ABS4VRP6_9PSEU|nr:dihydrolipoamide acetyltransferase family protein [Pseudonocardia parietis]MBP2366591.1 pyruvate dehydrogenase E2 component (dihydrolipoamide acetyltransferase) [Pseudonocardia parietis]